MGVSWGVWVWVRRLCRMSPDTHRPGSARSSAVVNAEIRALWQQAGGWLTTPEERAVYERLVVEWAAAVRAEVVEAA